jgi:hypothetical protein
MLQFIKDRDGTAFLDSFMWILLEQAGTAPIPQIVNPIFEHKTNRNFTGGNVIPDDLIDVDPREQFRPWSSDTAIFMGQKIGMSPLLYDHYVRGYLGTLGMYLTMASDSLISGQLPEGPIKPWEDRPIVRRFTRSLPLRRTAYEDSFYELKQEIRNVTATFNKIKAEGRNVDAYLNEDGRSILFGVRLRLDSISREATKINRALRVSRLDPTTTPAEKTETRKQLIRDRNKLFRDVALVLSPATVRKMRERLETEQ